MASEKLVKTGTYLMFQKLKTSPISCLKVSTYYQCFKIGAGLIWIGLKTLFQFGEKNQGKA